MHGYAMLMQWQLFVRDKEIDTFIDSHMSASLHAPIKNTKTIFSAKHHTVWRKYHSKFLWSFCVCIQRAF